MASGGLDGFVLNGQPPPLLITDIVRWQQVIFDTPDGFDMSVDNDTHPGMAIRSMSGSRRSYRTQLDRSKNVIAIMRLDDDQGIRSRQF